MCKLYSLIFLTRIWRTTLQLLLNHPRMRFINPSSCRLVPRSASAASPAIAAAVAAASMDAPVSLQCDRSGRTDPQWAARAPTAPALDDRQYLSLTCTCWTDRTRGDETETARSPPPVLTDRQPLLAQLSSRLGLSRSLFTTAGFIFHFRVVVVGQSYSVSVV